MLCCVGCSMAFALLDAFFHAQFCLAWCVLPCSMAFAVLDAFCYAEFRCAQYLRPCLLTFSVDLCHKLFLKMLSGFVIQFRHDKYCIPWLLFYYPHPGSQYRHFVVIPCWIQMGHRHRSLSSFHTGSTLIVNIEFVPNPYWIDFELPYRNLPFSILDRHQLSISKLSRIHVG